MRCFLFLSSAQYNSRVNWAPISTVTQFVPPQIWERHAVHIARHSCRKSIEMISERLGVNLRTAKINRKEFSQSNCDYEGNSLVRW